jgi:hypothetical protein
MLQEPTGLTISCNDVALRLSEISLLFPSGLSPHPTNAPLSRFPASEGDEDRKKGIFEIVLLHLGVVLLLSERAFIFVVLSSYN